MNENELAVQAEFIKILKAILEITVGTGKKSGNTWAKVSVKNNEPLAFDKSLIKKLIKEGVEVRDLRKAYASWDEDDFIA